MTVTKESVDMTADALERSMGGFNFQNYARNVRLLQDEKMSTALTKYTKTGTTIAGLQFKDGIVLGADTRSTAGPIVANKNCEKIHHIAPNIYCCGAGTAADCDQVTGLISSQLNLQRRNTGEESLVVCALTRLKRYLFRYQGYVSAALVLGGFDSTGPHLHTVWPHGSTDTLPYVTMGSGSLCAMAVFEAEYKRDMSQEEAMELVQRAILSGIANDMGSGSNVDLCVITKKGAKMHRNRFKTEIPNKKDYKMDYPRGTTPIIGVPKVIPHRDKMKPNALTVVTVIPEGDEEKKEEKKMDIDD